MKKKLFLFFVTLVTVALTASAYFNLACDFSGKVGTYPVEGSIELGNAGEIWGSYGYKKNGNKPKSWLSLEGEWESSSSSSKFRLRMTESSNGKNTGTWNVVYDSSKRTITGTMKTNGKTYKVNITTSRATTYSGE